MISLTGSRTDADDSLKDLTVEERNCKFADESSDLKIHKIYSFTSCMFECSLIFAQEELLRKELVPEACMPWFFPPPDDSDVMCDPWETLDFIAQMDNVTDDRLIAVELLSFWPKLILGISYDIFVSNILWRPCNTNLWFRVG